MDERLNNLKKWLETEQGVINYDIELASGDASFRRYFRLIVDGKTTILMDAPPEHEDCVPYLNVAQAFRNRGLHVPQVHATNLKDGFLWLSDLGDQQYADVLNSETADSLYRDALDALFKLQTNKADTDELVLPEYDHALLWREMMLFEDWFLGKHLGQSLSEKETQQLHTVFEFLAQSALSQTQVWVHRDYHSRNLMAVNADNPGVLDFQDAVNGPITYDLVSLLRDCYVAWPLERVEAWVAKYYDLLISQDELKIPEYDIFLRWFDLMGVQRHLKAIGIFSRLNYRDGKPGYLADIPRTLNYVQWVCEKYPELSFLKTIVMEKIVPVLDPESGRVVQGI